MQWPIEAEHTAGRSRLGKSHHGVLGLSAKTEVSFPQLGGVKQGRGWSSLFIYHFIYYVFILLFILLYRKATASNASPALRQMWRNLRSAPLPNPVRSDSKGGELAAETDPPTQGSLASHSAAVLRTALQNSQTEKCWSGIAFLAGTLLPFMAMCWRLGGNLSPAIWAKHAIINVTINHITPNKGKRTSEAQKTRLAQCYLGWWRMKAQNNSVIGIKCPIKLPKNYAKPICVRLLMPLQIQYMSDLI